MISNTIVSVNNWTSTKEIIFIDSQLDDISVLIDGVRSGLETVILDRDPRRHRANYSSFKTTK